MKWITTFLIGALVGAAGIYVYAGTGSPKPVADQLLEKVRFAAS